MHKANAERLRREQASATVANLETITERVGHVEERLASVDAKIDRVLELLEAPSARKARA